MDALSPFSVALGWAGRTENPAAPGVTFSKLEPSLGQASLLLTLINQGRGCENSWTSVLTVTPKDRRWSYFTDELAEAEGTTSVALLASPCSPESPEAPTSGSQPCPQPHGGGWVGVVSPLQQRGPRSGQAETPSRAPAGATAHPTLQCGSLPPPLPSAHSPRPRPPSSARLLQPLVGAS